MSGKRDYVNIKREALVKQGWDHATEVPARQVIRHLLGPYLGFPMTSGRPYPGQYSDTACSGCACSGSDSFQPHHRLFR